MRQKDFKALFIRMNPEHKEWLEAISSEDGRTQVATIERLIEREYNRRQKRGHKVEIRS